ncbi:MAG: hypothetical protein MRJ65_07455 [Candidatus Brocadiaceae bacterium]|nr:hypothetical protein [Candidatus Brocadiaceae bacterium]
MRENSRITVLGFDQGRCCHDAIKRVEHYKQEGYHYVLYADIKVFTTRYLIRLLCRGYVRKLLMVGY